MLETPPPAPAASRCCCGFIDRWLKRRRDCRVDVWLTQVRLHSNNAQSISPAEWNFRICVDEETLEPSLQLRENDARSVKDVASLLRKGCCSKSIEIQFSIVATLTGGQMMVPIASTALAEEKRSYRCPGIAQHETLTVRADRPADNAFWEVTLDFRVELSCR